MLEDRWKRWIFVVENSSKRLCTTLCIWKAIASNLRIQAAGRLNSLSSHLISCVPILLFVVCLSKGWIFCQGVWIFWRGGCTLEELSMSSRWWAKPLNYTASARVEKLETDKSYISHFLCHSHLGCARLCGRCLVSHSDDGLALYMTAGVQDDLSRHLRYTDDKIYERS